MAHEGVIAAGCLLRDALTRDAGGLPHLFGRPVHLVLDGGVERGSQTVELLQVAKFASGLDIIDAGTASYRYGQKGWDRYRLDTMVLGLRVADADPGGVCRLDPDDVFFILGAVRERFDELGSSAVPRLFAICREF